MEIQHQRGDTAGEFTITDNGKQIGHLWYINNTQRYWNPTFYLEDLFTADEYRNRGVATTLMNEFLNFAWKYPIYLDVPEGKGGGGVYSSEEYLIPFYEKFGFKVDNNYGDYSMIRMTLGRTNAVSIPLEVFIDIKEDFHYYNIPLDTYLDDMDNPYNLNIDYLFEFFESYFEEVDEDTEENFKEFYNKSKNSVVVKYN